MTFYGTVKAWKVRWHKKGVKKVDIKKELFYILPSAKNISYQQLVIMNCHKKDYQYIKGFIKA